MKRPIMSLVALALLMAPSTSRADAIQGTTKGDLESNISLLNLFEKQPDEINRMYRSAYGILSASRESGFADLAGNADFQRICRENSITHLGGPMLGGVTPTGASVWIRTIRPASVEVRVTAAGRGKTYGPVSSTLRSDLAAVVPITGLKPDSRYRYQVLIDGREIDMPDGAVIATTPAKSGSANVRIAFGSCFHRWGLGNPAQAAQIIGRRPAAMLLLGDIAVQDRNNHLGLHRADYLMRDQLSAWRNLVATVPVYATWDDHDYFANDKAGVPKGFTPQDKAAVCDVFRQAWNNPSYGFGDERRGVFLRTRIGPCDVLMLDNRYFRDKRTGEFLGDGQMAWLEKQLIDCNGPFIVLSCGTMWSDHVSNGKDSWGRCDPEGRERIFKLIEKKRIGGVLLISGDRHGARGFTIPRPSGFTFHEFEAGSLGGRSGPPAGKPEWTTQLYGIAGRYAFGEFEFDTTPSDPEVTFRLIGDDGSGIYKLTLKRSQLTPP